MSKYIVFTCLLFSMASCVENRKESEIIYEVGYYEQTEGIGIDSLIRSKNKNSTLIKETGKIGNLDILNGIHGFELGMSFDSIDFTAVSESVFDSTYFSEDILIYRSNKEYDEEILGKNTRVYLLFYKYHLEKIKFSRSFVYAGYDNVNDIISFHEKPPSEGYSIKNIQSILYKMFGEPNKYSSNVLKQKTSKNFFGVYDGTHYDRTEEKWQGENIFLSFYAQRNYKYPNMFIDSPYQKDFVIPYSFECSLSFENLNNSNVISSKMKKIENLKDKNKSIENEKERKERLLDKF